MSVQCRRGVVFGSGDERGPHGVSGRTPVDRGPSQWYKSFIFCLVRRFNLNVNLLLKKNHIYIGSVISPI